MESLKNVGVGEKLVRVNGNQTILVTVKFVNNIYLTCSDGLVYKKSDGYVRGRYRTMFVRFPKDNSEIERFEFEKTQKIMENQFRRLMVLCKDKSDNIPMKCLLELKELVDEEIKKREGI